MQEIILILVFMAAIAYLGWRFYLQHMKKKDAACGGSCGCESTKPIQPLKPKL